MPSKRRAEDGGSHGGNLPPLLAAYLGRSKNGQPLQWTLTSGYGGNQPLTNLGGNLSPNDCEAMEPGLNVDSSLEQRFAAIMGYRKKKWGMNENEGFTLLFIVELNLEAKKLSVQA
ncbi:hypothetical protein Tco_1189971 [Tanacetum coccineum]